VGGRPATTVEVPDANHLLVKLPENLAQGSYLVAVTNEAGTALASDELVIDDTGTHPSTLMMLVGGGVLLLLLLVMRRLRKILAELEIPVDLINKPGRGYSLIFRVS